MADNFANNGLKTLHTVLACVLRRIKAFPHLFSRYPDAHHYKHNNLEFYDIGSHNVIAVKADIVAHLNGHSL